MESRVRWNKPGHEGARRVCRYRRVDASEKIKNSDGKIGFLGCSMNDDLGSRCGTRSSRRSSRGGPGATACRYPPVTSRSSRHFDPRIFLRCIYYSPTARASGNSHPAGRALTYRTAAHVIPQGLGQNANIFPPGMVCDGCNPYFGRTLEPALIRHPTLAALLPAL
jgi:hypothetical protein